MKKSNKACLKVDNEADTFKITGRMLNTATSLYRAAEILNQVHNGKAEDRSEKDFLTTFHGVPILLAQAAEISLKTLWYIGHNENRNTPPHCHNLTKLHDALPKTIQKLLEKRLAQISNPSHPHFPMPYREGLRTILEDHKTALVEWRYIYEHSHLNFENVFKDVLNTLLDVGGQLHSQWREKL
ncbi:MAG: hypothetical protein OXC62_12775 [Aestuariivita sp.]|nr:hypothetical protein [Aestuariivita sp.]